jgi:hypothetical protein
VCVCVTCRGDIVCVGLIFSLHHKHGGVSLA